MAIVNPTPADFRNNQQRALDYQQYRSSSDIMRAVAEFYKVTMFDVVNKGKLNFVTNGLNSYAQVTDSKLNITVESGYCVFDNQPIQFTSDFTFEYDKPTTDTDYYVYIYYKYVEEYPANYAYIKIDTNEIVDSSSNLHHHLTSKISYNAATDTCTVDNSFNKISVNSGLAVANSNKGVAEMAANSLEHQTIVISDKKNGFSIEEFVIADGTTLVIPDGSVYKIL